MVTLRWSNTPWFSILIGANIRKFTSYIPAPATPKRDGLWPRLLRMVLSNRKWTETFSRGSYNNNYLGVLDHLNERAPCSYCLVVQCNFCCAYPSAKVLFAEGLCLSQRYGLPFFYNDNVCVCVGGGGGPKTYSGINTAW